MGENHSSHVFNNMRKTGVTARGIICPIVKEGDDLKKIVVDNVLEAAQEEGFKLHDRDIVAVTESILARSQGNYATVDDIAKDVFDKLHLDEKSKSVLVVYPILSRNRFAMCLKGIARACIGKKVVVLFPFDHDEVGNVVEHPITGVNYEHYYSEIIAGEGAQPEFLYSDDPENYNFYKHIIVASIHTREELKEKIKPKRIDGHIITLQDILSDRCEYGVLGSNKASEEKIKLFPHDSKAFVESVKEELKNRTGLNMEVMVYGDGAFKDPVSGIWEFADPVVSPGYTDGLEGTPNEVKIKYLADDKYDNLHDKELADKIKEEINTKDKDLTGNMLSQGTTPRRIRDLVGSLCDLVSGSGDKGTPVVLVQGYFNNFATEETKDAKLEHKQNSRTRKKGKGS